MALKHLENIVLLFLQILMSLLHLLIHGEVFDGRTLAVENTNLRLSENIKGARHRDNSSVTQDDGDDDKQKESEKDREVSMFDIAKLLNKWNAQQQINTGSANGSGTNRSDSDVKPSADKKYLDKHKFQHIAEDKPPSNRSMKCLQTASKFNLCNNEVNKISINRENSSSPKWPKQSPNEKDTAGTPSSLEKIQGDPENDRANFQKSKKKNKHTSAGLKRMSHTNSILKIIDMCLSKSKNNPLEHNFCPFYPDNTTQKDNDSKLISIANLSPLKCQRHPVSKEQILINEATSLTSDNFDTSSSEKQRGDVGDLETKHLRNSYSEYIKLYYDDKQKKTLEQNFCDSEKQENIDNKDFTVSDKRLYGAMGKVEQSESNNENAKNIGDGLLNDYSCDEKENRSFIERQENINLIQENSNVNEQECSKTEGVHEVTEENRPLDGANEESTKQKATRSNAQNSLSLSKGEPHAAEWWKYGLPNENLNLISDKIHALRRQESIISDNNIAQYSGTDDKMFASNQRRIDRSINQKYRIGNEMNDLLAKNTEHASLRRAKGSWLQPEQIQQTDSENSATFCTATGTSDTDHQKFRSLSEDKIAIKFLLDLQQKSTGFTERDSEKELHTVRSAEYLEDDAIVALSIRRDENLHDDGQKWISTDAHLQHYSRESSKDTMENRINSDGPLSIDVSTSSQNNNPIFLWRSESAKENRRESPSEYERKANKNVPSSTEPTTTRTDTETRTRTADNEDDTSSMDIPKKRIKHRWRKYGNPNENPNLVRDRMYAVRRREKLRQRYEEHTTDSPNG